MYVNKMAAVDHIKAKNCYTVFFDKSYFTLDLKKKKALFKSTKQVCDQCFQSEIFSKSI